MAHGADLKAAVRASYVQDRQNLKAAARLNKVSYETARSWKAAARKKSDDWDRARTAVRLADSGLGELTRVVIEDFVHLFQSTLQALKTSQADPIMRAEAISRLSDAYQKTVKAAGATSPELARFSIAMDVLQELSRFVRERFPHHSEAFLEILEPFGERLTELYG